MRNYNIINDINLPQRNGIFCKKEVSKINFLLKNELMSQGYTYIQFAKKLKRKCSIDSKSKLSKRISGIVKFNEDEIQAVCEILGKNPCEIFFGGKFLNGKQKTEMIKMFTISKQEKDEEEEEVADGHTDKII